MNIIDYSIKNRIVTLFFTIAIILGGLYSYMKVGKLEDPEFKVKEAIVMTIYPGASPHQVELEVTDKIENALQQIPNVEYIESVSKANLSEVRIKLKESLKNEEIDQYWDNVRKKMVDVSSSLPTGTTSPIVLDDYGDVYGMFFAITSDGYSKKELDKYVTYIQKELRLIDGVSKTTVLGKNDSAIEILVDRDKIANLGINEKIIMASFLANSLPAYTSGIIQGEQNIRINIDHKFNSLEDIENFVVFSKSNLDGSEQVIRVRDIGEVRESYVTPLKTRIRYNGMEAMGLMLSPEKGTNVVDTGKAIDKKLDEIRANLPAGIEIEKVYYQPDLVTTAIGQFVYNLIASVAVVVGILLFTMGMRTGLIIGSGLVLSILGTIIFMLFTGIDMQRVSLGSFIVAMGMLVDNSIVVADGILVGFEKGEDRYTALTKTAKKTAIPLLAATSIAIIAFLPMYLMKTDAGTYVSSLFWIIAVSLGLSWILALTQTPVFCDLYLKVKKKEQKTRGDKFYKWCRDFLEIVLKYRRLSLGIIVGAFILSALLFFKLPLTFFPDSDKKGFYINLWTPTGTTLDKTAEISKIVEKEILKDEGVINVTASIGASPSRYYVATIPELPNDSLSQLIISVKDLESVDRIGKNVEKFVAENIPDVKTEVRKYVNGIPTKYPVELRVLGPDPKILRDLGKEVAQIMSEVKGTKNIQTDWKNKVLAWTPKISQSNEKKKGISPFDIANGITRATDGITLGKYSDGTNQLPILLKEKSGVQNLNIDNIGQIPIWGLGVTSLPLNQIIDSVSLKWEDPEIWRRGGIRALKVQCEVEGRTAESVRQELDNRLAEIKLPENYKFEWAGEYYEQEKNINSVLQSVPLQAMLMFSICVLLFASLKDPIIIFAILPLSFIGIVPGLFLTGKPFGFMSIIGAISLSGMMIKNSIVLIDEIKYEINEEKKQPYVAVVDSAVSRIRPVSMTSATTILGMLPLVTDPLYSDMAITIVFGLTVSTILTLFVVPLLYTLFYKIEVKKEN